MIINPTEQALDSFLANLKASVMDYAKRGQAVSIGWQLDTEVLDYGGEYMSQKYDHVMYGETFIIKTGRPAQREQYEYEARKREFEDSQRIGFRGATL